MTAAKKRRALRLTLLLALLTVLLWVGGVAVYVWSYASRHATGPADAIVVLGAAQWNGRPSPVFAARLDHAIELYRQGAAPLMVFTGGKSPGARASEAEAGRRYAIRQGVPRAATEVETVSRTTWENLEQVAAIARRRGLGRVLVVSDPLHMARAIAMARALDLDAHPSPTPSTRFTGVRSRAHFLLREVYFYNAFLAQRLLN